MENDKSFYEVQKNGFSAIFNLKFGTLINKDTLRKYSAQNVFFSFTQLIPNNGRFEGFKSSGKIGTIENSVLQNDIMDLYQENISSLLSSTKYYLDNKSILIDFFQKDYKRFSDSTRSPLHRLK